MKITLPSIKSLVDSRLCATPADARKLRLALRTLAEPPRTARWRGSCYNEPPKQEIRMEIANELLGTHGVEAVHADDDGLYGQGSVAFTYCNAGDTYTPTIIRRPGGVYRVSTVGDEIERLERKGVHVK